MASETVVFCQGFSEEFAKLLQKNCPIEIAISSSLTGSQDVQGPDIVERTEVNVFGVAVAVATF